MTIEAAFVETLKLVKKLEDELREVKRNSSTLGIAVKKGREYTLSSDAFTAEYTYHVLTPQTGNTDDLSTINGGLEGRVIAIRTADAAYTITVKDGVGNIDLCGSDLDLDCEEKVLVLVFDENLDAWIQFGVGSGGAAGASDFLTLTDTPSSYSGQGSKIVAVNSGESALEFISPSGGNIVLNAWMPDAPPESPSAYDDEFDDSSFDTGLWTEFDPNTQITVTEDEAGLRIQQTGTAGDDNCGVYQSIPAGDFTIETKVSISGQDASFYIGGLALWEDPTDVANGNMDMFVMSYYASASRVMYYRYSNHETYSAATFTGVDVGNLGSPVYLRLRRNGTTYYYTVSGDGVAWMEVWTGSLTFTPTTFGLGTNLTTTSAPGLYARFQFFRYRNSDVGNHGLLYGRRVEAKSGVQNLGGLSTLTISSGAVTISSSTGFYSIAAETGASDDLTTINGGSDGDIIVLCPDTGDTISVLETGNLQLSGTFTMDDPADKITLIYHSAISKWCEITSSGNA